MAVKMTLSALAPLYEHKTQGGGLSFAQLTYKTGLMTEQEAKEKKKQGHQNNTHKSTEVIINK